MTGTRGKAVLAISLLNVGIGLTIARADQLPIVGVDPTVPIRGTSRAYDGDGIYVGDVKIRLWGIDAPELGTPDGDAAFDALAKFDGHIVHCVPPPWSASYYYSGDRIVALCQLAATGVDLARVQVIAGHAEDWPGFSRGFYSGDERAVAD